jgi:hypothetical protein
VTRIRIILAGLLVVGTVLLIAEVTWGAATISVPLDTIVRGAEGDIKPLRDPVPVSELNAQPGDICDVAVTAGNPGSMHDGTDLLVGSNGDEVVATNVEETSGKVTQAVGTLTLGTTVTFDGRIGIDEVISAGMDVEFRCSSTPPPNDVPDWCDTGIKFDNLPGILTFTVPEPPAGTTWILLVLKAGLDNFEIPDPVVGQAYSHPNGKEISHAIICYEEVPPSTTTTIPTTTTTVPPISTTTTTGAPPSTTTTTVVITTTSTLPPPTSSTSTTTVPPDPTTTTEVPPPTLIESGDAGYIGEADDGHEHGDEGFDWLFFGVAAVFSLGAGLLTYLVLKRRQQS